MLQTVTDNQFHGLRHSASLLLTFSPELDTTDRARPQAYLSGGAIRYGLW
jgi:hypothetical protein